MGLKMLDLMDQRRQLEGSLFKQMMTRVCRILHDVLRTFTHCSDC